MNSQSTAARTPVLKATSVVMRALSVEGKHTLPARICPWHRDWPSGPYDVPIRSRRHISCVPHLVYYDTTPHSRFGSPRRRGCADCPAYWQATVTGRLVSWDLTERCLRTLALHEHTTVPMPTRGTRTEYFPTLA